MKNNNIYRDVKLIRSAQKIRRAARLMSAFSVIITAGFVGFDLLNMIKNKA
ncbi:MAG: hypothetical protein J1E34_07150 [Oscillospiraceae bacterium]|nr:hypothetical protein [Oscillospiraceae bacterium]